MNEYGGHGFWGKGRGVEGVMGEGSKTRMSLLDSVRRGFYTRGGGAMDGERLSKSLTNSFVSECEPPSVQT